MRPKELLIRHEVNVAAQGSASTAMDAAQEAIRLVLADPRRAMELAVGAAAEARAARDAAALSVAERALGLIARERQDLDGAIAHLRRAIRVADRADHAE